MSASLPHHLPGHQAAALTSMVRQRLRRQPPPLPRADGAVLKAAFAILVVGALTTAAALYWTHRREAPSTELQPARVGEVGLMIPRNLTGIDDGDSDRSQLVGMARLRLAWPDLGPAGPDNRYKLLITLSPPDKVNEPARQLATYARFLTSTVWSNPGGLVVRGFRKGSPFEGDEFYVSVPDGRGFAARCPIATGNLFDEPCRVTFQHRGMDVNIRFPRAIITDWAVMLGGVRRTLDGLIR
jgi:hypothetical protein